MRPDTPLCPLANRTVWGQYKYCALTTNHFGPHLFSLSMEEWVKDNNRRTRARNTL